MALFQSRDDGASYRDRRRNGRACVGRRRTACQRSSENSGLLRRLRLLAITTHRCPPAKAGDPVFPEVVVLEPKGCGVLDCPPSRAMTAECAGPPLPRATKHTSAFSRHEFVRAISFVSPSSSSEGAGKAGCWSHPWSACRKKHAAEPQVTAEQPAFPARMGYGLYALSPGTGLFAPVIRALAEHTDLASAPGCQDHTTSPSADIAPRRICNIHVHRIPRSTSVTTRTPLKSSRDGGIRSQFL